MSANQSESDYEKQFQDDLAKATALSLEQQVYDELRRTKKYGTTLNYNEQETNATYSQIRKRNHLARLGGDNSSIESTPLPSTASTQKQQQQPTSSLAAPPPLHSQRRHSEIVANSSSITTQERSKTPPANNTNVPENDLISFASPTTKYPENSTFEQLIEDLQKWQGTTPQSTALVPLGPTAAAPVHPIYHSAPPTAMCVTTPGTPQFTASPLQNVAAASSGAAGMALVPFVPPPSQQKVPLTNEELKKLYNMPTMHSTMRNTTPGYHPHHPYQYQQQQHIGFVPPAGYYAPPQYPQYPQTAPATAPVSAAYMPPQYPPIRYGFQQILATSSTPSVSGSVSVSGSGSASALASTSAAATYYQTQSSTTTDLAVTHLNGSSAIVKSHSISKIGSAGGSTNINAVTNSGSNVSGSSGNTTMIRQTNPARKQRTNDDLIDLTQDEKDDSRVSVLDAFDPLLLKEYEGVWKK